MSEENKSSPFGIFILFGCLIIGGFVFPYLFFLAGVLAIVMLNDRASPQIESVPPTLPRRLTVTAADADWKDEFLYLCESPAETAFLEAAVTEYGLVPANGKLKGSGLIFELQVVTAPYRVDFLVEGWLVVEIDGAAYHSSPEAKANDAARDEILQSRGYSVLRIPAKTVFASGAEAVRRVDAALSERTRKPAQPTKQVAPQSAASVRAPSPKLSYRQILGPLSPAVSGSDKDGSILIAKHRALTPTLNAHRSEKSVIEAALKSAEQSIRIEENGAGDSKMAGIYNARDSFSGVLGLNPSRPSLVVPPLGVPEGHEQGDSEINRLVQIAYQDILKKHAEFLDEIRTRLHSNLALADFVEKKLLEWDYGVVWERLAIPSADICVTS